MNTEDLVTKEIHRIAKEIKEIRNSGTDQSKDELVNDAVKKHGMTSSERDRLRDLLAP
jgi:hypothetical protein